MIAGFRAEQAAGGAHAPFLAEHAEGLDRDGGHVDLGGLEEAPREWVDGGDVLEGDGHAVDGAHARPRHHPLVHTPGGEERLSVKEKVLKTIIH